MTSTENGAEPLLRLRGVSKNFGPVQALTDVDLEVRSGEVTALIGDNGAGKSVLIKCIAGIHPPEHGEILWEGKPVRIRTPRDSAARGSETGSPSNRNSPESILWIPATHLIIVDLPAPLSPTSAVTSPG